MAFSDQLPIDIRVCEPDLPDKAAISLAGLGHEGYRLRSFVKPTSEPDAVKTVTWPERIEEVDFIIVTCSLKPSGRHMINANFLDTADAVDHTSRIAIDKLLNFIGVV